jgi:hypothetical protein
VLQLDGAAIEPTEHGFRAALGGVLGRPVTTLDAAAAALAAAAPPAEAAAAPGRCVLLVDTVERLLLLDDWLRRRLVPALPDHVRVVLAGRDAPAAAWTAALGELLSVVALAGLDGGEAEELLRRAGVRAPEAARINRLAHGHPLSLRLAASALAARPGLTLEQATVPAVVDQIAALYLEGLDPATRRALDAAAVVRRPTRSLLEAMLGEGEDAWRGLDALPFTETGPDGLVLHDTVRAAVDAALRAGDLGRRRRLRAAAFARLQSELRDAPPAELGATPPTCSSWSTTRSCATASSRRAPPPSPSSRPPPPTAPRFSPSRSATSAPPPGPSPAGGRRCRRASASPATGTAAWPPSCSCASREPRARA